MFIMVKKDDNITGIPNLIGEAAKKICLLFSGPELRGVGVRALPLRKKTVFGSPKKIWKISYFYLLKICLHRLSRQSRFFPEITFLLLTCTTSSKLPSCICEMKPQ